MIRKTKHKALCSLAALLLLLAVFLSGCGNQGEVSAKIQQIACGEEFTLFLFDSGRVFGIGKNTFGQLGVGDCVDRYTLTETLLPEPVNEIGVSDDTAYALSASGNLYLWGDNRYRQAENSETAAITQPVLRTGLPGTFKQFALGWTAAFLLTEKDEVYGWGNKLALTNLEDYEYDPIYQATPLLQNKQFAPNLPAEPLIRMEMIAAGSGGYMGITKDRTLFASWKVNVSDPFLDLGTENIVQLALGGVFEALLTKKGDIYLLGDNVFGELGFGDHQVRETPERLSFADHPVQSIAVGPHHILALTKAGEVFAWGNNQDRQLGLNGSEEVLTPIRVDLPEKIVYLATGFRQSYFIGQSGKLYACGDNSYGQLFSGDQKPRSAPEPVDLQTTVPEPERVQYPEIEDEIIVAETMNAFLTASGRVFTVGTGEMGSLGNGKIDEHKTPTYVPMPAPINQIESGDWTFTVLTREGEVYNWGWGRFNALGHGLDKYYPTPVKVPLPEKIVKIRCANWTTAALSASGQWYMWGENRFGALGTGNTDFIPGPVAITTPVPFAEIAPDWSHFLGLTPEGELYQWGNPKIHWVEAGVQVDIKPSDLSYQKIELPETPIKIQATERSDYALSESGKLYAWGEGTELWLGIEEEQLQNQPRILLENIQDFVASPYGLDMLALTKEGEVYYWGKLMRDDKGLLSPVKIPYPEKIIAVFPGEGMFYVASEEHMYMIFSTWLEDGMASEEFPQKLEYHYQP
jgi:alpha-tubulin suppressor-like RCC1 family protein